MSDFENHRLLGLNDIGYVSKCDKRDHIHLCAGNVIAHLSSRDFESFRKAVRGMSKNQDSGNLTLPNGRDTVLRTSFPDMTVVFTVEELLRLAQLVDDSFQVLKNGRRAPVLPATETGTDGFTTSNTESKIIL
jgi:hypothetical protein